MKDHTVSLKLKIIYFSIFGSLACFYPFLTIYFQEKGLSFTQIGLVYAIWSITGVISQPIWGFITDKYSNKKRTIMMTMGFSAIAIFGLIFANSFILLTLAVIVFFWFQSPIVTVTDAYTYEIIEHNKGLQYGKIRFLGSTGYGITSLLLGLVVSSFGITSAFYMYSVVVMIGFLFIWKIEYKGEPSGIRINFGAMLEQLKDVRFMFFIVFVMIFSIPFGSNMAYVSFLIKETGGGFFELGLFGFIVAGSEFLPLHFGSRLLRKLGDINMLMISMFFYSLRYLFNSIGSTSQMVLLIQTMQCVTYPVFLLAAYQYISRTTSQQMRTTAMTIFAASLGLGGLIGNIGGGMLLERISIFDLYKILSGICLFCCLVVILLKKIDLKHQKEMN